MNTLVVISDCFRPATATSNRLLAILHGLDSLDIHVEMVFAYENNNRDHIILEQFSNRIKFHYLLKSLGIVRKSKYIKLLFSLYKFRNYIGCMSDNAPILLVDGPLYLPIIRREKRFKIYAELTEHPSISMMPSLIKGHIKNQYLKLNGLFVISTALKEYYKEKGVENVEIINMIVDGTRFSDIKKNQIANKYIAYCGTVTNNKDGVNDLIQSFAYVHKVHPDYKLYIIGPSPLKKEKSGNIELINKLGLSDSIILTGRVSNERMPQLLCDATVLVLARPDNLQAKYGFPTKLGEYLMTGNPVVVTRVGDIPIFLEDRVTALLAEPGNCQDISNKIEWAIEHTMEAQEIGNRGRKVAEQQFNNIIETKKIVKQIFGASI